MSEHTFKAMSYGPIGKAVESVMPHTEADAVAVLACTYALFSAALNGNVMMESGRPVVIWTVLAGKSAMGRKGYALNTTRKLLAGSIGRFLDTHTYSGISSGPSLVNMMHEQELETAGTESGADGRTLVVEEEWAAQLKTSKRDARFSQNLRMVWDGKAVRNVTKKETQVVEAPLMGFHAHITPGEWVKYVGGSASDALGGSFNRILPVLVERSKLLPYDHVEDVRESKALTAAYKWASAETRFISLAPEAGRRYDELRAEIEERIGDMPERLSCFMERSAEQVVRVAAVLTAAERKTVITKKALDAAWAFVSYSMNSVEKLVNEMETVSARRVKTLPEKIRERLLLSGGQLTSTKLLRGLSISVEVLESTVSAMDDVERATGRSESGRGAPQKLYRLKTVEAPQSEAEMEVEVEEPVPVKVKRRKLTVVEPRPAATRRPAKKAAEKPNKAKPASKPTMFGALL